jgi:hypothetical protein
MLLLLLCLTRTVALQRVGPWRGQPRQEAGPDHVQQTCGGIICTARHSTTQQSTAEWSTQGSSGPIRSCGWCKQHVFIGSGAAATPRLVQTAGRPPTLPPPFTRTLLAACAQRSIVQRNWLCLCTPACP